MLVEIEQVILDKLNANGLTAKIFDSREDRERSSVPVVYCAIEEGNFSLVNQVTFRQEVSILLVVVFTQRDSEKDRRAGIYPILEGITGLLALQDLGLDISPLTPVSYKNITDLEDAQRGQLLFQFEFKTSFTIKKVDEQTAEELLTIGLKYYLQDPVDDGVSDAEDEVTLT